MAKTTTTITGEEMITNFGLDSYKKAKKMQNLSYQEIITNKYSRYDGKLTVESVIILCYIYILHQDITTKLKLMRWIMKNSTKIIVKSVMGLLLEGQLSPSNQEIAINYGDLEIATIQGGETK